MLLNLPKLNLLTYKKFIPPHLDPDEDYNLNRVNFKKLLPYSRLGKNLGYSLKNTDEKDNKRIAFMTEPKYCLSKDISTNIKSIRNTNEIVFSSANKEFDIEKRINTKRKKLEDILCVDTIPRIDSYEVLVKKMFNKKKLERKINNNKNNKLFDAKKEEESFFDGVNNQIQTGFNILNDIEKNIYLTHKNHLKQNNNSLWLYIYLMLFS